MNIFLLVCAIDKLIYCCIKTGETICFVFLSYLGKRDSCSNRKKSWSLYSLISTARYHVVQSPLTDKADNP